MRRKRFRRIPRRLIANQIIKHIRIAGWRRSMNTMDDRSWWSKMTKYARRR